MSGQQPPRRLVLPVLLLLLCALVITAWAAIERRALDEFRSECRVRDLRRTAEI